MDASSSSPVLPFPLLISINICTSHSSSFRLGSRPSCRAFHMQSNIDALLFPFPFHPASSDHSLPSISSLFNHLYFLAFYFPSLFFYFPYFCSYFFSVLFSLLILFHHLFSVFVFSIDMVRTVQKLLLIFILMLGIINLLLI